MPDLKLGNKLNLTILQGSYFAKSLYWLDETFAKRDLTNYTPRLSIRDLPGGTLLASFLENYDTFRNQLTQGRIDWIIPSDVSALYDFDQAFYDLEIVQVTRNAIAMGGSYTSAAIDVDNGSGGSTITANGGTPFSSVSPGDIVRITASESDNEASGLVASATNTVITFANTLPGSDNADDTTLALDLLTLDEETVLRVLQGRITLDKNITT